MMMNRRFLSPGGGNIIRSQEPFTQQGDDSLKHCVVLLETQTEMLMKSVTFNCTSLIENTILKLFRGHFIQKFP